MQAGTAFVHQQAMWTHHELMMAAATVFDRPAMHPAKSLQPRCGVWVLWLLAAGAAPTLLLPIRLLNRCALCTTAQVGKKRTPSGNFFSTVNSALVEKQSPPK